MNNHYHVLDLPFDQYFSKSFILPSFYGDDRNPYISTIKDRKGLGFGRGNGTHNSWIVHDIESDLNQILSAELIKYLNDRSFELTTIWLFYFPLNTSPGQIHCDWGLNQVIDKLRTFNFALNWSAGTATNQRMCWYRTKNPALDENNWPIDAKNLNGSPVWDSSTVEMIDHYSIKTPTLVRTDIPHNGENLADGTRWAISLKPKRMKWKSWEEVVEVFS